MGRKTQGSFVILCLLPNPGWFVRFSPTFTLLASFPHTNPQFCCQKWRLENSGEEEQFGLPFVSCVNLAHPSWTQNPVQSLRDWFWRHDTLKKKIMFNWRIIDLQYCTGFCHIALWISHKYTYISSFPNLPPSPYPILPLWVVTEHWIELPALYNNFLLAVYFTNGNVYLDVR